MSLKKEWQQGQDSFQFYRLPKQELGLRLIQSQWQLVHWLSIFQSEWSNSEIRESAKPYGNKIWEP